MSAIFPTSLPWQTVHDFDIEGRTTIIGNVDGEIIDGTTHHTYDFVCRTLDVEDDSQSHSIAIANAEFIVRECNSHDPLVRALEKLAESVDRFNGVFSSSDRLAGRMQGEMWSARQAALRVIAKARGAA